MTALLAATSSTDIGAHVFWLGSRAAGVVAITMLSFTVMVGLVQGGRLPLGVKARDLTRIHEFVSLAALVAIAAHGLMLLGDPWLKPALGDLLVPFKLDYRTFYTGLGITGAWIATILGLSYYVRDKIGIRRWKSIHRFTMVAWLLSFIHVLGAGTDSGAAWLKVPVLASGGVIAVLFALRVSSARSVSRPTPAARPPAVQNSSRRSMPPARPTPEPNPHR